MCGYVHACTCQHAICTGPELGGHNNQGARHRDAPLAEQHHQLWPSCTLRLQMSAAVQCSMGRNQRHTACGAPRWRSRATAPAPTACSRSGRTGGPKGAGGWCPAAKGQGDTLPGTKDCRGLLSSSLSTTWTVCHQQNHTTGERRLWLEGLWQTGGRLQPSVGVRSSAIVVAMCHRLHATNTVCDIGTAKPTCRL